MRILIRFLLLAFSATAAGAEFDLSGIVHDGDRAPVDGATVWLVTPETIRTTETDATGAFTFADQPAGRVSVVAYHEAMAIGGADVQLLENAAVELEVAPAIDMPLRTVDPRMRPIAGARLARLRVNDAFDVEAGRLADAGLPSVRSGPDGRFTIPFLAEGDVARIEIDHRSFARNVLPTLPAGTAIDTVLPFGEPARGRVLTPDAEAAEGAEVKVFRAEGGSATVGDGVTGPDGFYTIAVPPGDYFVTARLELYGIPRPVKVQVALEQGGIAPDLVLKPTTPVSGATLDEDGEPVSGVHVRYVQDRLVLATTVSDSTGRYALRANLGEGTLRFSAPRDRAILGEAEIQLSVSGDRPLALPAIRVAKLPVIEGVVAVEGEPLDAILVSTINLRTNVFARADEDGRFTIPLQEFPNEGVLSLRAEHAYRFLRGDVEFHVFDDPSPRMTLGPFQPNLSPANEGHPNNLKARVGKQAPELATESWVNADEPVTLRAFRGRVVVLTMWASFDESGRARDRMRELQRWHEIYSDDAVAFVAVHEGTTPHEQLEAAVKDWGITFPVGRDTEEFETFDRYSTNFVPQTVLIDRKGIVRHYEVDGRLGELIKDLRRR